MVKTNTYTGNNKLCVSSLPIFCLDSKLFGAEVNFFVCNA